MSKIYTSQSTIQQLLLIPLFLTACQSNISENLPGMELHADFQLEKVASEPLIFDPVDMEFDEKGRAFVLEMPGYPNGDEESRLVLLTDTDSDGIYDQRKVFADSLELASSFMHYKGGILVAAPPYLILVRDTDQDDVADERELIMTGFSNGNLQHNYNGLTYGLDNWIYAGNGGNSGEPYFTGKPETKLDLRGDDIRFRIEEKQLQRVGRSSGGFGLAFDDWGHMFETHNLYHISHLVFESRYTEGMPVRPSNSLERIPDHVDNGLSRIYPIGEQESRVNHPEQSGYFSGSCGITFYGGESFPEGFNDGVFVTDVVLNLVHFDVLSPNEASFKASRKDEKVEFLASSDRASRPVNMATGPDGALYVLDMYRDVIEHPEWIPDELEVNMDLTAGKEKGRIYRISPKGIDLPPFSGLDKENVEGLIKSLGNKNQWIRMTAQRLLVEVGDSGAIPQLEQLIQGSDQALARLHAMWTLQGMNSLKDEYLLKALNDEVAGVRENALKIAEGRLNENEAIAKKVIEMAADEDARVRMQAALSLSLLNDELHESYANSIREALTGMLSAYHADTWTNLAVACAVKRQAVAFVHELIGKESGSLAVLTLGRWVGRQRDAAQIGALLKPLGSSEINIHEKSDLIGAVAEGWGTHQEKAAKQLSAELTSVLEEIERDNQLPLIRATGNLRKAVGLPPSAQMEKLLAQSKTGVFDAAQSVENRQEHLALLALAPFSQRESILYQLLDNRQPLVLQRDALQQLWDADQPGVGKKLLDLWPTLGPEARRDAGNVLLRKSYNHDLLLTALESGKIKAGELNLDLERRRTLLWSDDENIKRRAEALFSDAGVVTRKEAIAQMRSALSMEGDAVKGSEVYSVQCGSCHRYGDMGQEVGPVLTEISRKSKESLLHDILDPNAAVDTRYLNHTVKATDGNIYAGIVQSETDTELTLRMMGGQEVQLNKGDIAELSSPGISFMPEGLENAMSQQDMANLLAFLQQMPQ